MAAVLTLAQQLDALIARIKDQVPAMKSVVGMEDLDDAMETDELLPAAVVVWSGDYPKKQQSGLSGFAGQEKERYWSVIVVLELTNSPGEALDLCEQIEKKGVGWAPCSGMRFFSSSGIRFVSKYDKTRVVYEVRFNTLTTI